MNLTKQIVSDECELHIATDDNFFAAICLHAHKGLPALGGCRFLAYPDEAAVLQDALRLSAAMRKKALISELPYAGGKAVIMKPRGIEQREVVLQKFAELVESLQGRYITTIDSGTTQADMTWLKQRTAFVTGELAEDGSNNDPSLSTALGMFHGMKAAAHYYLHRETLQDVHIAIQGVGHVGFALAELLQKAGARLTICDKDETLAQKAAHQFQCEQVSLEAIYSVACDIFAPCGLGRVLHEKTMPLLRTRIVAGAANDQLATPEMASLLERDGIVYVPDYLINAGGLIHLAELARGENLRAIAATVAKIETRLLRLAAEAAKAQVSLFEMTERQVQVTGAS